MKWVLADHDAGAVSRLAVQARIHPLIARLLVIRGITDSASAQVFLSSDLSSLSDPFCFSGMQRSVDRILRAIASREKIIIYGDYDVDGVSGSAVLYLALRELGGDPESYIPDRISEGYGLNDGALRKFAAAGARIVITVDCGITAVREAKTARDLGIDLIITDHHESAAIGGLAGSGSLPDAYAVIHPGLAADGVPDRDRERIAGLTGAGVAFKLVQGLFGRPPGDRRIAGYLDLVTLGTIADMGKITGENRVLVKHGLDLLSADQTALRPGVAALKKVSGLGGRRVSTGTVGFTLAPRINAGGRLTKAETAFRLLTTSDHDEAQTLATSLDAVNRERQAVEEGIWTQAREECLRADLARTGAFVLASDAWHPGVIGIVASRIVDEFYRPAALISLRDGVGKGSARSIPGFDLYQGLAGCSDLLLGFGGHKYAAGLTVAAEQVPLLRDRLNGLVLGRFADGGFVRTLNIDAPVSLGDLTLDLMRDMERLSPYGQGNPEPRLGAKGLEVLSVRTVGGSGQHLKLRLREREGTIVSAIAFGKGEALGGALHAGSRIAAVFSPQISTWNDAAKVELELRDVKVER